MSEDAKLRVIITSRGETRGVTRRELLMRLMAAVGAGAAWPFATVSNPLHKLLMNGVVFSESETELGAENWKLKFLDGHQNEALVALSESIVPGSEKAQVNRFIDLLLSVDTIENQEKFLASLAAIEKVSLEKLGQPFAALAAEQREAVLASASAEVKRTHSSEKSPGERATIETQATLFKHFDNLKGWISGAYYSSEAGMRELGWTGDYAFESYPGCSHGEEEH